MTLLPALAQPATAPVRKRWRPGLLSRLAAFAPLWALIHAKLDDAGLASPMFVEPTDIGTIGANALTAGLPLLWMLLGVFVLWNARSPLIQGVVYAAFTIPALLGVLLGPAIVLILQNPS